MSTPKFSSKDPIETVLVSFDFMNLLSPHETITGSVWSIETISGIDVNPSAMLYMGTSVNGSFTLQLITGGIEGNVYHIHSLIRTSLNQTLRLTGSMEITGE